MIKPPSHNLLDSEHSALQREMADLSDAIEIVENVLDRNVRVLSYGARRILQDVWAYLHECYCASGRRPVRGVLFIGGENKDRSNGDLAAPALPTTRKWARVRGVPMQPPWGPRDGTNL